MAVYSIYAITNMVNKKIYIGKTIQTPNTRFNNHKLGARDGSTTILHKAIRKYGEQNFKLEVIFVVFNEHDLSYYEQYFISTMNTCVLDKGHYGYNMTRGGDGGNPENSRKVTQRLLDENKHPFQGERGSVLQRRKLNVGTHPFQGVATQRAHARTNKLVSQGRHILQGESGSNMQKKRIADGTHPLAGKAGSELQTRLHAIRVANGTHNFQSVRHKQMMMQKIEAGVHQNNVPRICPHCKKEGKGNAMLRYHFDKCKLK